ncbi:flagellar hook assembly protein FlgD [Sedimentibacter sp. MB31-C6]|uniref:flagellar hook assembly protein FlgD n=1 Tax=Sedimentibacter sp. MB31-C6 TaxID=3109366 RepID=UPI002DDDAC21|nr:flagellar hook capping FlgD N-terminal domain-containing protein [Sedimentibacter sp. MB36-C1]WSI04990.1 flagellar hook capping FlgD N-terminal domain-containing protein [Sedimentibacter sp. MB36-C1]
MEINAYNQNSINSLSNSQNLNIVNPGGSSLDMQDFLNLLVAQMSNQDAMNPMENTEFVSQLAQFSSLQAMTDLSEISQQEQATSLIGKTVIVANYNEVGELVVDEGKVEKVTIYSGETNLYVNGQPYTISNVMEVKAEEKEEETNVVEETLDEILEEIKKGNRIEESSDE